MVADDEAALTGEVADYIQRYGMRAIEVNSFGDLVAVLQQQKVDAILLDQRFGTVDTLVMLPQLRSMTDVPILMHTGNREEMDRVLGLEQGADDFLISNRQPVPTVDASSLMFHGSNSSSLSMVWPRAMRSSTAAM